MQYEFQIYLTLSGPVPTKKPLKLVDNKLQLFHLPYFCKRLWLPNKKLVNLSKIDIRLKFCDCVLFKVFFLKAELYVFKNFIIKRNMLMGILIECKHRAFDLRQWENIKIYLYKIVDFEPNMWLNRIKFWLYCWVEFHK